MIGETVSHYRIIEKLGEGGMGEVFLAEDTSLHRKVALKFLPEHLYEDDLARKRFLREAESAASLDHPYICHINEVAHMKSGQDFIVMEYVEGETLKDKLSGGSLSLEEAVRISGEIADALEMAHERGIVHRDLKPANIMLTSQGHVKVKVAREDRKGTSPVFNYVAAGKYQQALDRLELALEAHDPNMPYIGVMLNSPVSTTNLASRIY